MTSLFERNQHAHANNAGVFGVRYLQATHLSDITSRTQLSVHQFISRIQANLIVVQRGIEQGKQ